MFISVHTVSLAFSMITATAAFSLLIYTNHNSGNSVWKLRNLLGCTDVSNRVSI